MIPHHSAAGNSGAPHDAWTSEVRRQAWIAIRLAATQRDRLERVLAYYLRSAMSHGLTLDECCEAGNLSPTEVRELTDPAVAA